MDDFLHNLRSGKLKQPDRGRRDYTDYKGPQRRAGSERRKPDYYAKVTSENFALVKDSLDLLAEHQKRIADAVGAIEKTDARIASALETIATMIGRHLGGQDAISGQAGPADSEPNRIVPTKAVDHRPDVGTDSQKPSDAGKPEILDIIASMRADGDSWEKIARHLDDQNISTVSGKGKWRGPAVKKFWDANA